MLAGHRVRVTVFESARVFRECLQGLLSGAGLSVVGAYDNPREFLESIPVDRPDVAVADLGASASSPPTALLILRDVREKHPAMALVVLAGRATPDAESCYREGAAAYVDADRSTSREVVRAVEAAAAGVRLFPIDVARAGLTPDPPRPAPPLLGCLGVRERQVLALIGGGADNLKIAAHLEISERTVKAHVTSLYRKTNVENRTQLAILARELGLRPPAEARVASRAEDASRPPDA